MRILGFVLIAIGVISLAIGGISYNDKLHVFHSETEVGPVTQKLYKELTGVQTGDVEAPAGWIVKV